MARPSRNGTYNGEKDGFYTWNGRMWVDSRVTSFNNGNGGLPFVGDLGLGDIGDFSDFKIDIPEIKFDPIHFENITLVWGSNPTGIDFTVSHNGRNKTKWSSRDFLNRKTFSAKAGGYGESADKYTVETVVSNPSSVNSIGFFPMFQVLIRKNGALVKTMTLADKYFTGKFEFKKEEIIVQNPPTGIGVNVDVQVPNGVSAKVQINSKSETSNGSEDLSIVDRDSSVGNLNVTLQGTDSTCNYMYELANSAGAFIASGNTKNFSKSGLTVGSYKLKIVVSKTAVPDPPKPSPSYRYRTETYYVNSTSTAGSVAASAAKVTTTATADRDFINFGAGTEDDDTIDISYSSTNADYVNFILGSSKTELGKSGTITISGTDLFQGEGKYTAYFQAVSRRDGTGNTASIQFNAIRKNLLPGPDILTIALIPIDTSEIDRNTPLRVSGRITWTESQA